MIDLGKRKALCFVGPHGWGKSHVIAKLAAHWSLQKKKVTLVNHGNERLGEIQFFSDIARLLDVPFEQSKTPESLRGILESASESLLIDTPGLPLKDVQEILQFRQTFPATYSIEYVLVLNGAVGTSVL